MLDILRFDVTFSRKALRYNAFRIASFLSTQERMRRTPDTYDYSFPAWVGY